MRLWRLLDRARSTLKKQSRMRRRQRNGGFTQHAQDSVPDAAVVVLDLNKKPVIKS